MEAPITSISQLDPNRVYTYADYLSWQLGEWVELIRGRVRQMAGASTEHQRIFRRLHLRVGNYLENKTCEVLSAPYDVRLVTTGPDGDSHLTETVVQPDLFVSCDPARLNANSCIGPPEWIVEIVSPSNASRDVRDKFDLYEEVGVGEYWIVYPNERSVSVYVLDTARGRYRTVGDFAKPGPLPCHTLPELVIDWSAVFPSAQS